MQRLKVIQQLKGTRIVTIATQQSTGFNLTKAVYIAKESFIRTHGLGQDMLL